MHQPWFDNGAFPLFLAPMAGVTDPVFRSLCKEMGADVVVTEFVSAEGVLACWERNRRYTEFEEAHRPIGIQLFGADGRNMGEAAKIIVNELRPDFIDINCGCPVSKVVGKNGGSSLLKNLPLLASVARGVILAVGDLVPVTAKIRTGWDADSICAPETCRILTDEGISMITIHGRTRAQQYSGKADWDMIDFCARAASVPIIGNGDVNSAQMVEHIRNTSAVRGIMIGRAAMENPWIFSEAKHYLTHGEHLPRKSIRDKWDLIIRHARLSLESGRYGDELHTMKFMRARFVAYTKGFPGAKDLRSRLVHIKTMDELIDLAQSV